VKFLIFITKCLCSDYIKYPYLDNILKRISERTGKYDGISGYKFHNEFFLRCSISVVFAEYIVKEIQPFNPQFIIVIVLAATCFGYV